MAFLGKNLDINLPGNEREFEMTSMGKPLDKNQREIVKWNSELDQLEKRKGGLVIALDLQYKMDESIYDTKSEFYQKKCSIYGRR